jgi:hypothetical protein
MRAGARKESVESRGSTAWNDGLHSLNGGGPRNGSIAEAEDSGTGTGGTGRGGADVVSQTTWFAPVEEEISDCPGGVCPVPWAVKEEVPAVKEDQVNHPSHYTDGGIECIEAIEAQLTAEEYQGYLRGNCVKYLWRWRHKGGKTDLAKAQWYLDRLLTFTEAQNG